VQSIRERNIDGINIRVVYERVIRPVSSTGRREILQGVLLYLSLRSTDVSSGDARQDTIRVGRYGIYDGGIVDCGGGQDADAKGRSGLLEGGLLGRDRVAVVV
jgi:hypothetical protein